MKLMPGALVCKIFNFLSLREHAHFAITSKTTNNASKARGSFPPIWHLKAGNYPPPSLLPILKPTQLTVKGPSQELGQILNLTSLQYLEIHAQEITFCAREPR